MNIDTNTGSIPTDDQSFSEEAAANSLLERWGIKDDEDENTPPSDAKPQDETQNGEEDEGLDLEDTDDNDSTDDTKDDDDGEGGAPAEKRAAADTDVVTIKVDDQEVEVKVSDLKRLYGQEAALTRKSQEVAAHRKAAEAVQQRHAAGIDAMYKRVEARWKKYEGIDFNLAATQLDADTYTALKAEAKEAHDEYQFVGQELDRYVEATRREQHERMVEQARESIEVLKDKIPNWSPETYASIRTFAMEQGLEEQTVNEIIHPSAVTMIWKAMQYDKAKAAATKKKNAVPKNVLKTNRPTTPNSVKGASEREAISKLQKTGSVDDAADALLARMQA